jgi:hypothetical protein
MSVTRSLFTNANSYSSCCFESQTLATLINRLDDPVLRDSAVIDWGAPIPSFGNLFSARVATVGLNPSNREFVDELGNELEGLSRRFHTLASLGLGAWADADARHLQLMLASCRNYFTSNPYDRWFKRLDEVIAGTGSSYYEPLGGACHIDLIPYATSCKWTELSHRQRTSLLMIGAELLALLLKDSPLQLLVLNGQSVVDQFQSVTSLVLEKEIMPSWSLPRTGTSDVTGIAYIGELASIAGIRLRRKVLVLGYNHNLQSSFGVTTHVLRSIRQWIEGVCRENFK